MSLAFIGGTGLCSLPGPALRPRQVRTTWGDVTLHEGTWEGREVLFLARHGGDHGVPPHRVNYRANIAALKAAGAAAVVATCAVGTLTETVPPGSLGLVTDFIDQTSGRPLTFFDEQVVHLDAGEAYCPALRAALLRAAGASGVALAPSATYLCTNGPRFETPAEIRAYRAWGADLVGMTNVPEVVLAREAELCYAAVAISTNWAAGISPSPLTHTEVEQMMAARLADVQRLFAAVLREPVASSCGCASALAAFPSARRVFAGPQ